VFLRGEAPGKVWQGETLFCVLQRGGELPNANSLNDKDCAARGGETKAYEMHVIELAHPDRSHPAQVPGGLGSLSLSTHLVSGKCNVVCGKRNPDGHTGQRKNASSSRGAGRRL
jgi:hypothetical protein